ncbi:response regulator, partial [Pseudoflavonifractor sp. BIOML-A4]|nr:response regulator [Pseudoflavonifractor sp. BIOML-A4]
GIWSDNEETLEIKVTPPFWATGWAFFVYILIAGIIMYFVYRTIRNINNLRNKIKVEKQLTEYKLVFFTNISHEFRTPLTLIQGALDRIHRTHNIPKEIRYSIKLMDKSTQRMLRLINQLLEFRKMQNNKLALSLEETDVIAFLYEIYLSFQDTAESKNMDFKFIPSVNSYKMYIDKGNIDKIAYNLLSNAFKYTPSGGKIEFSIYIDKQKQLLIMKVTDTGVGIPKEKRDELFKRFMQSSFSGDSIGVGLHLSHELVQVHKGTIEYKDNEGGGSVFTVCIPTDKTVYSEKDFLVPGNLLLEEANMQTHHLQELSEECQEHEKTVTTSRKHKILVIEDDNDIRGFLQEELSAYFEVEVAADGISGFEKACNYDADLIICDVLMPGMTGFEVTKKLKTEFATSHIPIILLTA